MGNAHALIAPQNKEKANCATTPAYSQKKLYFCNMHPINESLKQTILAVLKRQPILRAAIFGSFARGEEHAGSDIDLLIEYSGRHTMFDILRLENELSEATLRKVDIVEYGAIKSTIKEKILGQAITIL
jgi:predicted nucleotidyltransferase